MIIEARTLEQWEIRLDPKTGTLDAEGPCRRELIEYLKMKMNEPYEQTVHSATAVCRTILCASGNDRCSLRAIRLRDGRAGP